MADHRNGVTVVDVTPSDAPAGADPTASPRHRRPRLPIGQLLIRANVVLLAALSVRFMLTPWLSVPLSAAAALLTVEWLVRYRRRGLVDATVVGGAALVVTLVALGLLLNLLPAGLTTSTWVVGGAFVAITALFLGLRTDLPPSLLAQWRAGRTPSTDGSGRSALVLNLSCVAVAIAVVAGAFVLATRSANDTVVYPVAISVSGDLPSVTLSVSTGGEPASYDLAVRDETGTVLTTTRVDVSADAPAEVPLTLPTTGRVLIDLTPIGATAPARELIVDNGQLTEETP